MIIDLTKNDLLDVALSEAITDEPFDRDAHGEWIKYVRNYTEKDPSSLSRQEKVSTICNALTGDRMRDVLKRAVCCSIKSEVRNIISDLKNSDAVFVTDSNVVMAAEYIVDLNEEAKVKMECKDKQHGE